MDLKYLRQRLNIIVPTRPLLSILLLLMALALPMLSACDNGQTQAANYGGAGGCWVVVPSPQVDAQYVEITAISAVSSSDIWAVGSMGDPGGDLSRTLTMHYDGRVWSIVPSPNGPNPDSGRNSLYEVSATTPDNVWAVGAYTTGGSQFHSIAMRYDGKAWNTVALPTVGQQGDEATAAAAVSPDDVWVTGSYFTDEQHDGHMYVLHWNGTSWERANLPLDTTHMLLSIAWRVPDDVWAVGTQVLHYNGANWRILPVNDGAYLDGVTALGPDNVWIVGNDGDSAITLHWDGQKLNVMQVPGSASKAFLHEAVSLPNGDVWVAGEDAGNPAMRQPLLMKWTGESWSLYPNPVPGVDARLEGITQAAGDLWAAGSQTRDGKSQPLFLHYSTGACK